MPFVYFASSASTAFGNADIQTSATPNTETDDAYAQGINFASTNYGRWAVSAVFCCGKSAGLTVISGIAYRLKKWTTTASSGGATPLVTPGARDPGFSFGGSPLTFGFRNQGASAVTSGTGGPTFIGGFTSGATGPGGWVGPNANSYMHPTVPSTSDTGSIDIFSASATPSLKYEAMYEVTVS